ncbi:MAG: peptide deformylase [bacterium]
MALREILHWPDPRLSVVCTSATVDDFTLTLARDMLETMYAAQGRGLAAPQVGVLVRVIVMDATWKSEAATPEVFINPEIIWRSDTTAVGPEGCLSIPKAVTEVARATEIILRWIMPDGAIAAQKITGFRAICVQHEIDHLDGILTLDRLSPEARAVAEAQAAAQADE